MKNFYLACAAVAVAATMNAESVKVEWLSGNNDGVTSPELVAVSNHPLMVAADVEFGAGLCIGEGEGEVAKVVDIDGNNQNKVGGNFAKIYPTMDADQPTSFDAAVSMDSYMAFYVEAQEPALIYPSTVSMDLSGIGTDAYRMQIVLSGEGDDGEWSYEVLTPENCHEFAPDGGFMSNGWRPSRNDGTKADKTEEKDLDGDGVNEVYTSIQSTAGYTHLVIPVAKVAPAICESGSYDFKVTVYMWGIASNKQYGIRNVVVEASDEVSGISSISADQLNVNAPVYNVMGQRVDSNAKGLLIQNGRKFYNR